MFARRFAEFGKSSGMKPLETVDMLKRFPVKLGIIKFVNGTIPYGNGAIASLYSQAINHRATDRRTFKFTSADAIPQAFVSFIFIHSYCNCHQKGMIFV